MKRYRNLMGTILLCSALLIFGPSVALATTITWNFDVPNGLVVSPHTYLDTTNTFSIVASGFTTETAAPTSGTWNLGTVTANNLFGKSSGFGETGLGLSGQPDHEIKANTLIQLDLIDLINHGLTDEIKIISSLQRGETTEIFKGDNAAANGATGEFVISGTGLPTIQTFTFGGPITSRYEWITATSGNVLLMNGLSATAAVPEPAMMLLLGSGLVGIAPIIRRKIKK